MKIINTDTVAKTTGEYITKIITEHDGDVLCLLSGGSALDAIEYIQIVDRSECRTIFIMGDERVSREVKLNNYLQVQSRYKNHVVTDRTVETVPMENESLKDFASRIQKSFLEIISELKNPKIISLLGVGNDGHTGSIFPMNKESFNETYPNDSTYVPVHLESLTIDSRASLTPSWIINNVDILIGYAIGKSDKLVLQSLLKEEKNIYELPVELWKQHAHTIVFTDQVL